MTLFATIWNFESYSLCSMCIIYWFVITAVAWNIADLWHFKTSFSSPINLQHLAAVQHFTSCFTHSICITFLMRVLYHSMEYNSILPFWNQLFKLYKLSVFGYSLARAHTSVWFYACVDVQSLAHAAVLLQFNRTYFLFIISWKKVHGHGFMPM